MKVLTVDDNPMTGILLQEKLVALGFEPLVVEHAAAALAVLEQEAPQIAILDWMMPGMNGLELACSIRQTPRGAGVYIIMLSGKESADCIGRAYSLGIDDFVRKPVAEGELEARIRAAGRFVEMRDCLADLRDQHRDKCQEVAGLLARLERVEEAA